MVSLHPKYVDYGQTITCVMCGLVYHHRRGNPPMPHTWRALMFDLASGQSKTFYLCQAHVAPDADQGAFERVIDAMCAKLGYQRAEIEVEHE